MNKIYGYARCSTNEDKQDIQRQIRELKVAQLPPEEPPGTCAVFHGFFVSP